MNWQNIDGPLEESKIQPSQLSFNSKMEQEENENELVQLQKFQDPTNNPQRQFILGLLAQFEDLLRANSIANTANPIFTEDCEFFLFSSTGKIPARYCLSPRELPSLYSGMQIQQRIVRETYIDLEKMTAFQFCNYKFLYQDEANPVDEIVAEVFTIKNNKITKYRAFIARMTPAHGDSDLFETTRKDNALAMVKRFNYALSGKPDLEKAATMLHENVKYKIWTWDSQKCFTFGKHDFVESFQNMQENFVITSIVPYDVYTESQTAYGTYVYHLEGITDKYMGKKYIWPCTCMYAFDDDFKITRVSQQGELHLEGEVPIPFEVYSRQKLLEKVQNIFLRGATHDLFYGDVLALNCLIYVFGPEGAPAVGCNKGTIFVDKNREWSEYRNNARTDNSPPPAKRKKKLVESFVDWSGSGYEIVLLIYSFSQILDSSKLEPNTTEGETIVFFMGKLEQGKIIKAYGFVSFVIEPIPSSFDHHASENEIFPDKNTI